MLEYFLKIDGALAISTPVQRMFNGIGTSSLVVLVAHHSKSSPDPQQDQLMCQYSP
jgi:hypothetical protein